MVDDGPVLRALRTLRALDDGRGLAADGASYCPAFTLLGEQGIEPEPGAVLSVAAVQDFLRSKLANFKVPKDIQFMDALPREATGKIFKRKLRDLHREGTLRAAV